MSKVRVLVVDDSVVVRKLVSEVLAADADIEVVATAGNGKLALQKLDVQACDLVTLDIEMPEMDGLQALAVIRKRYPKLPVIMFSSLTSRAAAATIDALSLGANDYVAKPEGGGLSASRAAIKAELIPKIRALTNRRATETIKAIESTHVGQFAAVAIGVSTGGPPALQTMLAGLGGLELPVFITQHMPASFTTMLVQRLKATTPLPIHEVTGTMRVEPGHIYLAAGDHHLTVEKLPSGAIVKPTNEPPENSCRPAVDVMFRSIAQVYGTGVLGLVMTGMGNDGLKGAEAIRDRGGAMIVQDQASSVVWGMPGAVARAGLAHAIVPLDEIAGEVMKRVRGRHGSDRMPGLVR
ncbi:MAG: chemotaxis-specific protein-glutamate methyltransferase CheB [Kofleriaceae bacterium]